MTIIKPLFFSISLLMITLSLSAQKKVAIKDSGIANKTIVVSTFGTRDYTILFTNDKNITTLSIGFTGTKLDADYVLTNRFEEETIRVKNSGFGDVSFKIKDNGFADLILCIGCDSSPDVLIYLEDWGNLSQEEIIALVHQEILEKVN